MSIQRFLKKVSFEDELNVLISGPLANVYAEALAKAYGKDENGDDTAPIGIIDTDSDGKAISMETQAMDVEAANQMLSKVLQVSPKATNNFTRIYATSPTKVNTEIAKEIISDFLAAPDFTRYILVYDSTDLSELGYPNAAINRSQTDYRGINLGVEDFVKRLGGHVVHSLEEAKEYLPGLKKK